MEHPVSPARRGGAGALPWILLVASGLIVPAPARPAADPPHTQVADPRFSSFSPVLAGSASGAAEPLAVGPQIPGQEGFVVIARDIANAPVLGRAVNLNFALSGARLCADQDSGFTVNCATQTLTGNTAGRGWVVFHPRFGGFDNQGVVSVDIAGVILGSVPVRSTDLNALGGATDLGDLSTFLPLYLARSTAHPEADFNASGGPIDLLDLTIVVREYELGAHSSYCP